MATNTTIDSKLAFLHTQIRNLSAPLSPSIDWQSTGSSNSAIELAEKYVNTALYQLNRSLSIHNKANYSSQATRHVAESIDALYWAETEPGRNGDLGEALERGRDFRIERSGHALPVTWPEEIEDGEDEEEVEEVERYAELREQLVELLQRRREAREKLERYKALQKLLDPLRNPMANVQPNLVTKDGELVRELEKMRMLIARVGGRLGSIEEINSRDVDGGEEKAEQEDREKLGQLLGAMEARSS